MPKHPDSEEASHLILSIEQGFLKVLQDEELVTGTPHPVVVSSAITGFLSMLREAWPGEWKFFHTVLSRYLEKNPP